MQKDDEERRKWSKHLYGIDTADPSLYDLVIHIKCMKVDDAVEVIKCALKGPCFRSTPETQKLVDDKSLAARVEAALIQEIPSVEVEVKEGEVFIYLKKAQFENEELMARVKRLTANIVGFKGKITCLMRP